MPTAIEGESRFFRNWVFRFRPATAERSRLLVMLHGWTGDENSMWVFARKLPKQLAILAPRGPYVIPEGGYSWCENHGTGEFPVVDDFLLPAKALMDFIDDWSIAEGINADLVDLIGFSQGAAFAYVLTFLHPERIHALAALSGFMPFGMGDLRVNRPLYGKSIFIAHGRQDEMVSVDLARKSVTLLEDAGAVVTYCESESGHKVSSDCYSKLAVIFGK